MFLYVSQIKINKMTKDDKLNVAYSTIKWLLVIMITDIIFDVVIHFGDVGATFYDVRFWIKFTVVILFGFKCIFDVIRYE